MITFVLTTEQKHFLDKLLTVGAYGRKHKLTPMGVWHRVEENKVKVVKISGKIFVVDIPSSRRDQDKVLP